MSDDKKDEFQAVFSNVKIEDDGSYRDLLFDRIHCGLNCKQKEGTLKTCPIVFYGVGFERNLFRRSRRLEHSDVDLQRLKRTGRRIIGRILRVTSGT